MRRVYREEPAEEEEHEYREAYREAAVGEAAGAAVGEAAGRSQEPRAGAKKSGHAAKGVASPEKGEKIGSATCVSAGCAVMVQVSCIFLHPSVVLCFVLYVFGFMQLQGILEHSSARCCALVSSLFSPLTSLLSLLSSLFSPLSSLSSLLSSLLSLLSSLLSPLASLLSLLSSLYLRRGPCSSGACAALLRLLKPLLRR